jgi:hypothetical protein
VFAFGLPLNAACLLYLLEAHVRSRRRLVVAAVALWLVPICVGVTVTLVNHGDIRTLQNKAELEIPARNPEGLASIVSQPVIRAILPPALVGEASAARAQQRGLARYTGRVVEALKAGALHWGFWLVPLGMALFAAGAVRAKRAPDSTRVSAA